MIDKSNWQTVRLGDVATFINGFPFKPSQWKNFGKPIIRIQNLTGSSNEINYCDFEVDSRYQISAWDILISWSASLGVYVWSGVDAVLNQHIFKVVFDKIEINKKYFVNAIRYLIAGMESETHGSTMKHITKGKFDGMKFPLPPLPVQLRIAENLDRVRAAIAKRQRQLLKLDEYLKSLFYEMFGDPVTNDKAWGVGRIGEITKLVSSGSTPLGGASVYKDTGVTFIRSQNVLMNRLDLSDVVFIDENTHNNMNRTWLKNEDVLLNITGASIGRVAVYFGENDRGNVNQHVCVLRFISKIIPLFASHTLSTQSFQDKIMSGNAGATRQALNFEQIKNFEIIVPPLILQHQFAARVSAVENHKALIQRALARTEELYNCLMQEYFG